MDKPRRIQRMRMKGWKMPENTTYVGRPTIWGNPFKGKFAVVSYRQAFDNLFNQKTGFFLSFYLDELKGKDLACWCPLDQLCHADILLEKANST